MTRTDVNSLGEFGLIDHLTRDLQTLQQSTIHGVGDDAAVIDIGDQYLLASSDALIEGIHFDMMYTPLKHLGYKSVVVNLSDICAMNGKPQQILVNIAISNRYSVEAMDELYAGIKLACEKYNVDLVGGDMTSSPKGLVISITALGRVDKDKIALRSGAKEGDIVCITGDLGAAYLGLQILEREKQIHIDHPGVQPELDDHDYLIKRLLKPEARLDMIEQFAHVNLVPTSMIDISDGLASELFHIARSSDVGFLIEENGVPINMKAQEQALNFKIDPITCALSGGEDYELLFTIKPEDVDKVRFMPDIYLAGDVLAASEGVKLSTKGGNIHALKAQGWNHFDTNA